jgi:hypothetical protein
VEEMMRSSRVMTAGTAWGTMPQRLVYKDTQHDLKKVLKVRRGVSIFRKEMKAIDRGRWYHDNVLLEDAFHDGMRSGEPQCLSR